jgi:HEAT repeat protein
MGGSKRQTSDISAVLHTANALIEALNDPDGTVRAQAARSLGVVGRQIAVAPLVGQLRDPFPGAVAAAACALGRLGDASVIGALGPLVGSQNLAVRNEAVDALGALRVPESVPWLAQALEHKRVLTRGAAIDALEHHGSTEALAVLRRAQTQRLGLLTGVWIRKAIRRMERSKKSPGLG